MSQDQVQENQIFSQNFDIPQNIKENAIEAIHQTNILFNLENHNTPAINMTRLITRQFLYNIYNRQITKDEFNEDMKTLKQFDDRMNKAYYNMVVVDRKVKYTKKYQKLDDTHNENKIKTRGIYNTYEVNHIFWDEYFNDNELIKQVETIAQKYFFHNKYSSSIRSMIKYPLIQGDYKNNYINRLTDDIYKRVININSINNNFIEYELEIINRALYHLYETHYYNNVVVQKFLRYNE